MHTVLQDVYVEGTQSAPPPNAYIEEDYPYGSLRCRMANWIEIGLKGAVKGDMRHITCTTNPKRGDTWNNPHPGIYVSFQLLYINGDKSSDQHGHVEQAIVHLTNTPASIAGFKLEWWDKLSADQQRRLESVIKLSRRLCQRSWAEYDVDQKGEPPPPPVAEIRVRDAKEIKAERVAKLGQEEYDRRVAIVKRLIEGDFNPRRQWARYLTYRSLYESVVMNSEADAVVNLEALSKKARQAYFGRLESKIR